MKITEFRRGFGDRMGTSKGQGFDFEIVGVSTPEPPGFAPEYIVEKVIFIDSSGFFQRYIIIEVYATPRE